MGSNSPRPPSSPSCRFTLRSKCSRGRYRETHNNCGSTGGRKCDICDITDQTYTGNPHKKNPFCCCTSKTPKQLEILNGLKTNMHVLPLFCYTLSLFHQNYHLCMCYDTQTNTPVHVCEKTKTLQYISIQRIICNMSLLPFNSPPIITYK